MIRGKYMNIGLSEMEGIAFLLEGIANQVDWRESILMNLLAKMDKNPGERSTFLSKREC